METFIINITSFPVAIYTVGLGVVLGYWLIAMFGLAGDFGVDADIDTNVGDVGAVAGLLTTLGLSGVPITIVISLLMLNGWVICYFASGLVPDFPGAFSWLEGLLNLLAAILSFVGAIMVTAIMIRPLRGLFKQIIDEPLSLTAIGRTCRVRSTRVDQSFGEVECIHKGASLILKVRSYPDTTFKTGDQVVLVEHNARDDSFFVVSHDQLQKELE